MQKILIGYLNDGRRYLHFQLMCHYLSQAKHKDKYHVLLLTSGSGIGNLVSLLQKYNIEHTVAPFEADYMPKIHKFITFAKIHNYTYCMKMDNDIILPSFIFDFIAEAVPEMSEEIGILLPSLLTSIPSAEYIIEDFFSKEEKDAMYTQFQDFRYSNEYSVINHLYPTPWNLEKYFQMVESITEPHQGVYKAIHPIRYNINATVAMNTIALTNKKFFFSDEKKPYIYTAPKQHYFMPQCFIMRLDLLEKVLDPSLAFDPYDEVSLNRLIRKENKKIAFIRNCFGLHIAHNGFMQDFMEYERSVLSLFFQETLSTLE